MSQGFDPTVPVFGSGLQSGPVRVNFDALFSSNSGVAAPANPVAGTLWVDVSVPANVKLKIYNGTVWVTLVEHIEDATLLTFKGSQARYVHPQAIASLTWIVNHNLNVFPSVTVVDAGNNQVIPNNIQYNSSNQITITFAVPSIGQAFIN